jgi:hypothetical protein
LTFSTSGDIYSLFIELAQTILSNNSISTMIVSNKWMRANYGQPLRKYIIENTNPISIIDFGQNLLFESAIVHTNIISIQKCNYKNQLNGVRFPDGYFNETINNFVEFIEKNTVLKLFVDENIWNIVDPKLGNFKNKVELIGKPLKNWNINFRRGALTGLNEVFIIGKQKKEELIKNDIKSNELLKPLLRGRDVRKYSCNYADLYLITTFPTYNLEIDNFRGIKEYLENYVPKLNQTGESFINQLGIKDSTRKKTNNKWFETQDTTSYAIEFIKPKIIFSEIVSEPQFYYDEENYYPEATVFFISGENLKYLTALLNSKAVTFLFKTFYMGGELVGKIRYKKAFLENVPLPIPTLKNEMHIVKLVDQILSIKKQNPQADTTALETEIDQLVYKLYDLTEEEIKIIEGV